MLIPGSPLGLITEGVQVLAGVLLPSATLFLLLLCNDKDVLGPWVNRRITNVFTSGVIAVLITLSVVLTASVVFPADHRRADHRDLRDVRCRLGPAAAWWCWSAATGGRRRGSRRPR